MKLSEAIREGAKLGPQAFGAVLNDRQESCAIGGAARVLGARIDLLPGWNLGIPRSEDWKIRMPGAFVECPCGEDAPHMSDMVFGLYPGSVAAHVAYLNDKLRWPRERIADWVRSVELADEAASSAIKSAEQPVKESEPVLA